MRKHRFLWVGIIFLWGFLAVKNVCADDLHVEAHVDNNRTTVGESITLSITVEGKSNAPAVTLPNIDGFDISGGGQMMNTSIINGAVSSSVTQQYYLMPQKKGHFQIPALEVSLDGKTYKTDPIDIDVDDVATVSPPASGSAGDTTQPASSLKDNLFLVLNVEKTDVVLNEKIPVRVTLLAHEASMQIENLPKIEGDGFRLEDFDKGTKGRKVINGLEYDAIQFRANLYPTRVGDVTVGPAKVPGSLLIKTGNAMDQRFGSLFDDDFFNQAFNRYTKKPIVLKSADVILHVADLPADGKPDSFSGAVGKYEFDATASPLQVHVGDPVTVRLTVKGDGNLSAVNLKPFDNNDSFKVYDPTTKQDGDTKTIEQVVVPKSESVKEIPAVRFSFFNTETKTYETVVKGPFALTVQPLDPSQRSYETASHSTEKGETTKTPTVDEKLGSDLIFIKDQPGAWHKSGEAFYRGFGFWLFVIFYVGLWCAGFFKIRSDKRLKTDVSFAKQLLAPRFAKQGLREIRQYLQNSDRSKFYDAVHRTIVHYFSHKLKIPMGNVDFVTVSEKMSGKKVPTQVLNDFKYILDACETARFAPSFSDLGNLNDVVVRLEKLIDTVERTMR